MAFRALKSGDEVSVYFFRPSARHPKCQALERAGARLFYARSDSDISLRGQIAARLGALSYRLGERVREYERVQPTRQFFATRPEMLLINEGGSHAL